MMALCWLSSTCEAAIFTLLVLSHNLYQNGGAKLSKCPIIKIELYEDAPEPITCQNLTKNGANVWRHHDDNFIIGECSAEGNCTNYFNNTYRVSRKAQSTVSQLLVFSNFKDLKADHITCEDKASSSSDTCVLVIKRHPVLSKCRVYASTTSGNVSGSCFADKMFSSDGLYACDWNVKSPKGKVTKNKAGWWGNTRTCKGDHCWGTCSFSHPQPQEKGLYTYTIIVLDSERAVYSQNIALDGNLAEDEHTSQVKRIIGVVVPVTIVTAAMITLIVVITEKRNQIQNTEQSRNRQDPTAVCIKEDTRKRLRGYLQQNEMFSCEDDTDCYDVVCDAIDSGYEICDDKDHYDKVLDDTNSSEHLSLSSEYQSADLRVNV